MKHYIKKSQIIGNGDEMNILRYVDFIKRKISKAKQFFEGNTVQVAVGEADKILNSYSQDPNSSCYIDMNNDVIGGGTDLSIIIGTYNNERFLKRCLDSVFNQKTQYSFQVIVVNDGSTDNTSDVLKNFFPHENLLVVNQKNRGISAARNIGIEKSSGRYLMFVDADDQLLQNAVQDLLECAISEGADVVAGNYQILKPDGKVLLDNNIFNNRIRVCPENYFFGQPWGKVYKRELFDHLRFPEGYWYEDSIFAQIVWPLTKKAFVIPEFVYGYTVNPNGVTMQSQFKPKSLDSLYITKRLLKEKEKFGLMLDRNSFEYFLRMVRLTYRRTAYVDGKIAKCIFVEQCALYKCFHDIDSNKYPLLQKSLQKHNYRLYLREVG